jgi:16S rRNA U1498 N3-methylase RsmE
MLHLNRVLFHVSEIDIASNSNNDEDDDGKNLPSESSTMDTTTTNYIAKVTLSRDDYRTIHVAKILKLQNGDTLRVGVVRHRPRSTNHHHHHQHHDNNNNDTLAGLRTDNATIVWITEGQNKVGAPTKNGDPPGSLCITIPHPPPPITTSSSSSTSIMKQIISTQLDEYDDGKENISATMFNNNDNSASDDINNNDDNDDVPRVSLLLALPRPLQLQRILPMVAQLGVEHILLTNANKVPKDYFGCRILRNNSNNNNNDNNSNDNNDNNIAIQNLLIEGLSICGNDVTLPSVTVTKKLHTLLVEQDGVLDQMFPRTLYARVIAHPTRLTLIDDDDGASNNSIINDDDGTSSDVERIPIVTTRRRMTDVVFPTSNSQQQQQQSKRMLVAVGPEGGWVEPYELTMFANAGFQQVSLGARVLRSDVAVISLLALANEVCYS